MDYGGRISKRGDRLLRTMLYEAADALLCRVKPGRGQALRDWAKAVKRRTSHKKAVVALVRTLTPRRSDHLTDSAVQFLSGIHTRLIAKTNPDMLEPVEMMAEGALELYTGRHVGRIIASREIGHYVAGKVQSLDGKTVLWRCVLAGRP